MMRNHAALVVLGTAALISLGVVAPAHAASPAVEGIFPIYLGGCTAVSEHIELQGSPKHDYIRWETDGNAAGCYAEIIRNGTKIEGRTIVTSGFDASDWYYDGPGYSAKVCVSNAHGDACGPLN